MIGWASSTWSATAILIVAVLLLRLPVARLFGARAAFALWLAPAARLFMPPLPADTPVPILFVDPVGEAVPVAATVQAGAFGLTDLLMLVWLGGAAVFLAVQVVTHLVFIARLRHSGQAIRVDTFGNRLVESDMVTGPIAIGLLRRWIVLPVGLQARLTDRQFDLAIAHEQLHHRRGDLWAISVSQALLALHWFNPFAHYAHRLFRSDLEAACDAQLAADLNSADRQDYARAIVRCTCVRAPRAACTLTTIDNLKRRLMMLKRDHKTWLRASGLGLAAILVTGGIAATAPLGAQERKVEKTIEKKIIMHDGDHAKGEHRMSKCEGEVFEASSTSEDGPDRHVAKIKLCAAKGENAAQFASSLEKAAASIEKESDMPAGAKAEILAQLRSKIAELRAR